MANGIGSPVPKTLANTTPEKAIIEPTDKSIPAVIITKVKPTAIIALMDVCWATFKRLGTVRKCGDKIQKNIINTNKPIKVPIWRLG